jgi:hypothetical protein
MTITWFIDHKNGLCGIGAPQAVLPIDIPTIEALKQSFRRGIYHKYAAWKRDQEQQKL